MKIKWLEPCIILLPDLQINFTCSEVPEFPELHQKKESFHLKKNPGVLAISFNGLNSGQWELSETYLYLVTTS